MLDVEQANRRIVQAIESLQNSESEWLVEVVTEGERCVLCKGPWHPASGQIVGSPSSFPVCGACFKNEIIPLMKDASDREIRVSSRAKRLWNKLSKKARSGKKRPWVSFYDYVTGPKK